jgi:hypothetical protein
VKKAAILILCVLVPVGASADIMFGLEGYYEIGYAEGTGAVLSVEMPYMSPDVTILSTPTTYAAVVHDVGLSLLVLYFRIGTGLEIYGPVFNAALDIDTNTMAFYLEPAAFYEIPFLPINLIAAYRYIFLNDNISTDSYEYGASQFLPMGQHLLRLGLELVFTRIWSIRASVFLPISSGYSGFRVQCNVALKPAALF